MEKTHKIVYQKSFTAVSLIIVIMAFEALPPRKRWKSHTLTSPFLVGVKVSVKMTIPEFLHSHMDGTVKRLTL